jgi:hypothetical protein
MELIPILSTIILVATISTFLLAIGAYILYKVREGRGQQVVPLVPSTVKAELLTPVEAPVLVPQHGPAIVPQPVYFEPKPIPSYQQRSEERNYPQPKEYKFLKYTSEGYVVPSKEEKSTGVLRWK